MFFLVGKLLINNTQEVMKNFRVDLTIKNERIGTI